MGFLGGFTSRIAMQSIAVRRPSLSERMASIAVRRPSLSERVATVCSLLLARSHFTLSVLAVSSLSEKH
ncbi:hypothetical protein A2U01_0085333 [Trifolium medium]|uniref:Uncharacterized protein n=1 Tax=Trifolium medium TaxID=97028 RepID=A0A392TVD8_9FABA|nr:hypothetical protein [Trifolium medium]